MQGIYKIGEAIEVQFQSKNAESLLTAVTLDIYDEAHALTTSLIMTEIGTSGVYQASFTPDAEGAWCSIAYDETPGKDQAVKTYLVTAYNIDSIGDIVSVISAFDSPAMIG